MLNLLKRLFKHNTKLYCFNDLYTKIGLDTYIHEMEKSNEFNKYHVDNIRCNSKTYNKVMQTFRYNLIKTKNKYNKMYKEPKLRSMLAFDSLIFGPSIREDVADNCIFIILPGDKRYKNIKKEDITL